MKSVSNADIRLKNNHNVYRVIYDARGGVTVREITEALKLSLPTVNTCVAHLMAKGLVEHGSLEKSTGGRKPRTLRIAANAALAVGLVLSAGGVRFLLANLYGETLRFQRAALPFADTPSYYAEVSALLETFIAGCRVDESRILGVSISIAGIINADHVLETVPTLRIKNKNTAEIAQHFQRRLRFVNDANASGFAEWWHSDKQHNFCCLFVEKGVGGSLMIHGSNYFGDNLRSAEFGHMVIAEEGRLCSCGKQGCLEAYCSTDRLSKDFHLTLDEFFSEVNREKIYRKALNSYLRALARGIANLRFIFDCRVCISGLIVPYILRHEEKLRRYLAEELPFDKDTDFLQFSSMSDKSAALGAALLWISDFIKTIQ